MNASAAKADPHGHYSDRRIRTILSHVRTIAMIGASGEWRRPSYFAMKYLQKRGYRVVPVNPSRAGQEILGELVYPDLDAVPAPIDMVDMFRPSEDAPAIVEASITNMHKGIEVVWMQLGVRDDEAARVAEEAGLVVIMNRCPKIEYGRLSGELGWAGVNTGVISSKTMKPPSS